jgi:hypothetical protein
MDQINDLLSSLELFSKSRKRQKNQESAATGVLNQEDQEEHFFDSQELPCSQQEIDALFQTIEPTPFLTQQATPRPDPTLAIQQLQELIDYVRDLEREIRNKDGRISSLEKSKIWLRSRLKKLENRPCSHCGR